MLEHRRGKGAAQNEPAQQPKPKPYSTKAPQAKTQESHGETAGTEPGHQRERTNRKNEPARQPSRSPTQPQQLRSETHKA